MAAYEEAMEPFHIGLCVFIFCGAIFALMTVSRKYTQVEDSVTKEIDGKIDVTTSVTDYTDNTALIKLTGAAVVTEIMEQQGDVPVRVNNELLNNIKNVNGTDRTFFQYLHEYGTDALIKKVSLTATYIRKIAVNEDGDVTEISYQIS